MSFWKSLRRAVTPPKERQREARRALYRIAEDAIETAIDDGLGLLAKRLAQFVTPQFVDQLPTADTELLADVLKTLLKR